VVNTHNRRTPYASGVISAKEGREK
jgi:hypothetical protein